MPMHPKEDPLLQNLPQFLAANLESGGAGINSVTFGNFPRIGAVVFENLITGMA
jgi:hypothetical protein